MGTQTPQSGEHKLVVCNEDSPEQELVLNDSVITLGREPNNDACVSWDPRVSRHHARLRWDGDDWVLEDLGSTNGTYVGQRRLAGPAVVRAGDTIRIGRTWLELRLEEHIPQAGPDQAEPVAQDIETPGLLRRALSSLGRVTAASRAPCDEPPDAEGAAGADVPEVAADETQLPPSGRMSCTISALSVEIRPRSSEQAKPPNSDELRAALAGLESSERATVKIVQPLSDGDAWVSISATPGHQADLLILAGRAADRLVRAGWL